MGVLHGQNGGRLLLMAVKGAMPVAGIVMARGRGTSWPSEDDGSACSARKSWPRRTLVMLRLPAVFDMICWPRTRIMRARRRMAYSTRITAHCRDCLTSPR
jgi:hypothetical protein